MKSNSGKYFWLLFFVVLFLGCRSQKAEISRSENVTESKDKVENLSEKLFAESNKNKQIEKSNSQISNEIFQTKNEKTENLKSRLKGLWIKDENHWYCSSIKITFELTDFCVESNQIFGKVYYELNEEKKEVYMYFKEPTDLGNGGRFVPFNKMDKTKPIAVIDVSRVLAEDKITVKWLGFIEKKSKEKYDYGIGYAGEYYKTEETNLE